MQVAEIVRQDRIDILVDLTLHMAENRLFLFARKPAPIQVTFAGYPGSTGLTTIDYRLSDPYLDPPEMDESVYSENTLRLPDSFWCYDPLDCRDISVNELPAIGSGAVTFGCLNNFCKINDEVLAVWAAVMRQVSNSRLFVALRTGEPFGGDKPNSWAIRALKRDEWSFLILSRGGNISNSITTSTWGSTVFPIMDTPPVWIATGWACR